MIQKFINVLLYFTLLLFYTLISCKTKGQTKKTMKSEEQWKKELTKEEYNVIRKKGTERPFTGKYNDHFVKGTYVCKACNTVLFDSKTKFDGHCGWPSFDNAIEGSVIRKTDNSHGMVREEILCASCGGHLGHIFNDGPTETGNRYCVNSVSLKFVEK